MTARDQILTALAEITNEGKTVSDSCHSPRYIVSAMIERGYCTLDDQPAIHGTMHAMLQDGTLRRSTIGRHKNGRRAFALAPGRPAASTAPEIANATFPGLTVRDFHIAASLIALTSSGLLAVNGDASMYKALAAAAVRLADAVIAARDAAKTS